MKENIDRNLGEQPIAGIMRELQLTSHDLVAVSTDQITHKMVKRASKGRRLNSNVKIKIRNAINNAAEKKYSLSELFNY